ncbi:MAG: ACP S-malonyltransferase [Planctomycetes bacterium]|nr:ACP S-malonyltransferase [Planctomycetota bacterium]
MPVILIDTNIEGHGAHIWMHMRTATWQDLTDALGVTMRQFCDVGLDAASPDDVVWRFCQAEEFYLLTSNRNEESDNSLEATLRREGTPTSLPVITLPLPDRVFQSSSFCDRVVEKLFDYLLYAENIRGAGRLYLP